MNLNKSKFQSTIASFVKDKKAYTAKQMAELFAVSKPIL